MDFLIAGTAAVCAGFFTNPLEVLKIRLQLQGELQAKGQYPVHYRNVFHAAYVVVKNDGILALQKGLAPALWIQLVMNGLRLGTYQFGESRGYVHDQNGDLVFYKSLILGGVGGTLGQYLASPLFLVKTHLQSQAVAAIAVGHQHKTDRLWTTLRTLYREHKLQGLFRGAGAAIPRGFVGSTSQLTSFNYTKQYLRTFEYFHDKPFLLSFCGSMVGGVSISVMVTPFDLVMTRLYNQPVNSESGRGLLYHSYLDCVTKIYRTEGLLAFYKGVGPMYFRLGPHSVLCLMFWDLFKQIQTVYNISPNNNDIVIINNKR